MRAAFVFSRHVSAIFVSAALCRIFAGQPEDAPLPKASDEPSFEIEPPLLIQDDAPSAAVAPILADETPANPPQQLQLALERAKKSAAAGERQFRAGIIARVEMELRALTIIRLQSDLAQAEVELAKADVAAKETLLAAGGITKAEMETAREAARQANAAAKITLAAKQKAELDAALVNLERQKKLRSLGSAKKADVNRAEAKVAELSLPKN